MLLIAKSDRHIVRIARTVKRQACSNEDHRPQQVRGGKCPDAGVASGSKGNHSTREVSSQDLSPVEPIL